MRDEPSLATPRISWRADFGPALAIGAIGAAELLLGGGQRASIELTLAAALIVTCTAVLARRRYPLAVALVASAAWFIPGVVFGDRWNAAQLFAFGLANVLLAYTVGERESGARGVLGLGALVLGMSAGDLPDNIVAMWVFTVPAWVAGQVVQARATLAGQLAERGRELDREREAFADESVRYERARIARELHDIVAHSVSVMVVQAGAGQRLIGADPARAAESFDNISEAAREAELEVGRLLELLGGEPPAQSGGGLTLIDELVRRAGATGLSVTCRLRGSQEDLPGELSDTAYRVAQEALTNALKHAPGAPVQVGVDTTEHDVVVTVENGMPPSGTRAPRPQASGYGLRGMGERVAECGGTIEAGPTGDGGWRVTACLPRLGWRRRRAVPGADGRGPSETHATGQSR